MIDASEAVATQRRYIADIMADAISHGVGHDIVALLRSLDDSLLRRAHNAIEAIAKLDEVLRANDATPYGRPVTPIRNYNTRVGRACRSRDAVVDFVNKLHRQWAEGGLSIQALDVPEELLN